MSPTIVSQIKAMVAKAAGVAESEVHLEHPELEEYGDYSTNLALVLKGGRPLAEKIASLIKSDDFDVSVAGGGFVNFHLHPQTLIKQMTGNLEVGSKAENKKKIMVEFGQPNTHKLPHIGHLFSYIYGEAACRLLVASGVTVRRVNYQGDVGPHVAKCLWAYLSKPSDEPQGLEEKVIWLQKLYQEGNNAYEENPQSKKEIEDINKKIYTNDSSIVRVWEKTRGWSEAYYKGFEKRLGIDFDHYYWESQVASKGAKLVRDNVGKVFRESEGAIVYEGSHTRVFVTSQGNPTYEAKDMALEILKMHDWPCDLLLITTASEQNDYFKVIFSALEDLEPSLKGKLRHIGFGMVNLKSGKISSRTGNIIGAIDLVNMVVAEAGKVKSEVAEQVGLGAIKYAFLKKGATMNMDFDINESISLEGNSGPYLQYTYARTQSVLAKVHGSEFMVDRSSSMNNELTNYELNPEELSILRYIYRFSEVIEEAASRFAPNLLCNFLYELAQRFNTFYNKCSILSAQKKEERELRLAMTAKVGEVLKNGLNLLGIEAPEKM